MIQRQYLDVNGNSFEVDAFSLKSALSTEPGMFQHFATALQRFVVSIDALMPRKGKVERRCKSFVHRMPNQTNCQMICPDCNTGIRL